MVKKFSILLIFLLPQFLLAQKWKAEYDYVSPKPADGYYLVRKKAEWGYVTETGKVFKPVMFSSASEFKDGMAITRLGGKYMLIDKSDKVITPEQEFDLIEDFTNGLAVVRKAGKFGYINKNGKLICPIKYLECNAPKEGMCKVSIGTAFDFKYGFLSITGQEIVSHKYTYAEDYSNGRTFISEVKGGEVLVLNKKGEVISNVFPKGIFDAFTGIKKFVNGIAIFKRNEKYGLVDTMGKIITEGKYDKISGSWGANPFSVEKNKLQGYLTADGKEAIPPMYETIFSFNDEFYWANKNGKAGLIDKNNRNITPFEYDEAKYFITDGLLFVRQGSKWGAINNKGKLMVPLIYDYVEPFREGKAVVFQNKKYGMIDATGKIVIPLAYEMIYNFGGDVFIARKDAKYGAIDSKEKILVPFEYDYCENKFDMGLLLVTTNSLMGVVDSYNNLLVPIEYNDIKLITNAGYANAYLDTRKVNKRAIIWPQNIWKK